MGKTSETIAFSGKIAATVLLKLFINFYKSCHTTDVRQIAC